MKRLSKFSIILACLLFVACGTEPKKTDEQSDKAINAEEENAEMESEPSRELLKKAKRFFTVLPEAEPFGSPITRLGKKLFYEKALSISGELSCNSCHFLDKYGVDNEPTSPGHDNRRGRRNSPTVYNAYFHISQFWDGRAADLKEQAMGPILDPVEMGMPDSVRAVESINELKEYLAFFEEAFPNHETPITYNNIAEAIGEFEKTLSTPAPFDDFLNGDLSALDQDQKDGLELFIKTGCTTCHMGGGLGGNMYQKFGLVKEPYWEYTGSEQQDKGRFDATGNEADKYFFKVPSLRNITKTAPYFHDGSIVDLGKAIDIMAETQLGKKLNEEEIQSIISFLESLTGKIPEHALQS